MTETAQLISTLKKKLKSQGMTYRDLAHALQLSEPSVKRILSSGRITLDRLAEISRVLGYTLAEITKEAVAGQPRLQKLTAQQEREVVSDTKLLIVTVCSLNHWTMEEIIACYKITKAECIKHLLRLDTLRIIDLLPNNRIRLNVARDFDWLPAGPIQHYFQGSGMQAFLGHPFNQANESMAFVHGMFTEQARVQIQNDLLRLRQKFAELHEHSLSAPLEQRSGVGLLLATRQWEPDDFRKLRR